MYTKCILQVQTSNKKQVRKTTKNKQRRRTPNRGYGSGKKEKKDLSDMVNHFLLGRRPSAPPSKKKKTRRNLASDAGYDVNTCNSYYY